VSAAGTVIDLEDVEASLLQGLVTVLLERLDGDVDGSDPLLGRFVPDAYPDDPDASAEFRHLTEDGLVAGKRADAALVLETLDGGGAEVHASLDADAALSWLRCLTDLRLLLADVLEIGADGEATAAHDPMDRTAFDWLGWLQDALVESLDD
jgi:Domain of unknown function (DUF2017)